MADYYDNYSVPLPYKTGEERKWLLERLEAELCEPENEKLIPQLFPDCKDFDASFWPGFGWKDVDASDKAASAPYIWIFNEDGMLPDCLFQFVQQYLRKFRPTEAWAIRWASTCSRPKFDGFTGGAAFVTAEKIDIYIAGDWINEREAEFKGTVNGNGE